MVHNQDPVHEQTPRNLQELNHVFTAAVIGLGQMGIQHASNLSYLTGRKVCIYDASDRMLKVAESSSKRFCVHHHIEDLLREETLAGIFVCTPLPSHYEITRLVIEGSNKNVGIFVEKPLSESYDSARELAALTKSKNRLAMVGFQKRFNGVYSRVKDIVGRGDLGEIRFYLAHSFSFDVTAQLRGWKYESQAGGATLEYGAHLLDLLIWWFGEPEATSSFRSRVYSNGAEDFAHATLKQGSVMGSVDIGWSMRNYSPNEFQVEIHGTHGALVANDDGIHLYSDGTNGSNFARSTQFSHASALTPKVPFLLTYPEYVLEDQHFVDTVSRGISPQPNFEEAARVNKLVEDIRAKLL